MLSSRSRVLPLVPLFLFLFLWSLPLSSAASVPSCYSLLLGGLDRGRFNYSQIGGYDYVRQLYVTSSSNDSVSAVAAQVAYVNSSASFRIFLFINDFGTIMAVTEVIQTVPGQYTYVADLSNAVPLIEGQLYTLIIYTITGALGIASSDVYGDDLQIAAYKSNCPASAPSPILQSIFSYNQTFHFVQEPLTYTAELDGPIYSRTIATSPIVYNFSLKFVCVPFARYGEYYGDPVPTFIVAHLLDSYYTVYNRTSNTTRRFPLEFVLKSLGQRIFYTQFNDGSRVFFYSGVAFRNTITGQVFLLHWDYANYYVIDELPAPDGTSLNETTIAVAPISGPDFALISTRDAPYKLLTINYTERFNSSDSAGVVHVVNFVMVCQFLGGTSFTSADASYLILSSTGTVLVDGVSDAAFVLGAGVYFSYASATVHPYDNSSYTAFGAGEQLVIATRSGGSYTIDFNLIIGYRGQEVGTYLWRSDANGYNPIGTGYQRSVILLASDGGGGGGGGSGVGDPQFVGLLGQSFQVHGVDGAVYNIYTSDEIQINSRFDFLSDGECPVYDGHDHDGGRAKNCWSHPGSYFGSLGVLTSGGDELVVEAGPRDVGISSIIFNGKQLIMKESPQSRTVTVAGFNATVELIDRHHMNVLLFSARHAGVVTSISLDSSDRFLNINSVLINDWKLLTESIRPHGILGNTWNKKFAKKMNGQEIAHVQGKIDDYAIEDNNILGCKFLYNLFSC